MHDAYDPQISVQGSGPPVVLVPGMDGTGLLFYRQVPRLARSYRVVTYSLRDDAGSMDVLVGDLARVIDTVSSEPLRGDGAGAVGGDPDPAIIVGESFGGALALSFALAHPERVAALVALNSFPRFLPQVRLHLAIWGLKVLPWGAMSLVRRLTAFRMHSRHTHDAEIERFLELTREATKEGYVDRLGILLDYDVRHRLEEIEVPALFLAADEDHLVPSVEQGQYMAERVRDADLEVLEGYGHVCLIAPDIDLERILAAWRDGPNR